MYSTTLVIFSLALLASATSASESSPTNKSTPTTRGFEGVFVHPAVIVEKFTTNAKRLAMGVAPAPPASLKRRGTRDLLLRPHHRRNEPPTASNTPVQTPVDCIVTDNAVPLWDNENVDDQYKQIDLPFKVQMYDQKSKSIFLSTNGVGSLSLCAGMIFEWDGTGAFPPEGHHCIQQL
jgi:hypothetical protein